jgi:hypothetical protein
LPVKRLMDTKLDKIPRSFEQTRQAVEIQASVFVNPKSMDFLKHKGAKISEEKVGSRSEQSPGGCVSGTGQRQTPGGGLKSSLEDLRPLLPRLLATLADLKPGELRVVSG